MRHNRVSEAHFWQSLAVQQGLASLHAPVRPTGKHRHPLSTVSKSS